MNKRILLSGLLAGSMSVASVSAACPNGGFAVGVKAGVNFAKIKGKTDEGTKSMKKTLFPIELFCGYATRINEVMLGLDVGFGTHIGKFKAAGTEDDGTTWRSTIKNTWYIDAQPRVGYLVTPATEIYATGGARFGQYKVSLTGCTSAKKVRIAGLVGAGVRYTFQGGFFLGGEYLHQLPTKLESSVKIKGHTIRLVFGMSF